MTSPGPATVVMTHGGFTVIAARPLLARSRTVNV